MVIWWGSKVAPRGWEFDGFWTIGVQRGACFKAVLGVVESKLGTVGWDVIIYYDLPIIQVIQVSEAKPYEAHMIAESRCELGGISFGPQAFDGLQRQRDLVCCILIWVNVCQKYPEIMLSIPKAVFSAPFISFSLAIFWAVQFSGHFPPCIFIEVAPVTTRNLDDNSTQPAVMDFWAIGKNCLLEAPIFW